MSVYLFGKISSKLLDEFFLKFGEYELQQSLLNFGSDPEHILHMQ